MNKIFVLTDIHGHYDQLMALYRKLPIEPDKDQLIILGDYVDRGPKSKQVVEQIIKWKKQYPHWVFLMGNHEDMMLDALVYGERIYHDYYLWFNQGGRQTISSYFPPEIDDYSKAISNPKDYIPKEHLEFLAALPRYYQADKYFFVHGGVMPYKKPEETDPQDMLWLRDNFIYSNYDWGKKIIYGHTYDNHSGSFEPNVMENKIGIDTAMAYGGKLTALELPAETFIFQS